MILKNKIIKIIKIYKELLSKNKNMSKYIYIGKKLIYRELEEIIKKIKNWNWKFKNLKHLNQKHSEYI